MDLLSDDDDYFPVKRGRYEDRCSTMIKRHIYNIRSFILDQEDIRGDIELLVKMQSEEEDSFARAIVRDDVKEVQEFLDNGFNPNTKLPVKETLRPKRRLSENKRNIKHYENSESTRFDYRPSSESAYHPIELCFAYNSIYSLSAVCASEKTDEKVVASFLQKCNNPTTVRHIYWGIERRLRKKYGRFATVGFGKDHESNLPMFIVSSTKLENDEIFVGGAKVKITNPSKSNDDEQQWLQYKEDRPPDFATLELLQNVRRKYEDELYRKHRNLNFISGSSVKFGKHGRQKKRCLVLYCSNKGFIPDGEEPFPKTLRFEGKVIDVDVREGSSMQPVMDRGTSENEPEHEKVKMGTRIRRAGNSKEGTVGPFLEMDTLRIGFLTCAHVFFHIDNSAGRLPLDENEMLNKVFHATNEEYGIIHSAHFEPTFGVDVAVVKITQSRTPSKGEFRQTSFEECQSVGLTPPLTFNSGNVLNVAQIQERVGPHDKVHPLILGNNLEPTRGRLHYEGIASSTRVNFGHVEHIMKEVYLVMTNMNQFIKRGDSGSGVFIEHEGELHCIGLAISHCMSGMYGCVTPIDKVLDVIGENSTLKRFQT